MSTDYEFIDLRGNTITLDPRSKIMTTLVLVLGVAISIDYFQILLYALLVIPIILVYRPRIDFMKRLVMAFPFIFFISIAFYLGIGDSNVTISVPGYSRSYNRTSFVGLIIFRYTISVLLTYILVFSEKSYVDIIEAIGSFRITQPFNSILMLTNRLSTRLLEDYDKMIMAATTKGAFQKRGPSNLIIKLRILGRLLSRTPLISNSVSNTLLTRGFMGEFSTRTRRLSSEGMSVFLIACALFIAITGIPWMRV